ncbi:MAG TPA: glutathione S-transferase family protein [Alphaproteobacteria bacterium]|nr:glutathione S-transferase family protein [Alphaproteobacteria bacterium]
MLDLYHWEPNTFSLKPLIALHEKGLDFTSHYQDWLTFEQLKDEPALNVEATHNFDIEGPILVNGDTVISESFFMLEYLDDAFPETPRLLPDSAAGKWRVRAFGRYLGERTGPAVSTLGCRKYLVPELKKRRREDLEEALKAMPTEERRMRWRAAIDDSYDADEIELSETNARLAVERCEKMLGDSEWLLPDGYSAIDIEAFAFLNSMPKLMPDACNADASPKVMDWLARMRDRPAVKAALATARTNAPDEAFAPGSEPARWG